MLIKEIHHRVKNNLTVISSILDLQKRNIKDEQMLEVFKDAKSRINSMALVHKNLYEQDNFATIDTQKYFENLYKTISSAYKLKDVKIETIIDCKNVNINIDTLIPLALITNELLTNSFKYAFEDKENGVIKLQLSNNKNDFEMNYQDNGVGLIQTTKSEKEKEGLGTLLINGLTKQLDGSLVKNSSSSGLHYCINFKGINV
jgi:two-component sensor histidine kinase